MKKFSTEKLPRWLQNLIKPDVIRTMQIKFIAMAMGILITVFIIMLTAINMIMKTVSQTQSMQLLEKIANSDRYNNLGESDMPFENGPPPEDMPPLEESSSETETILQAEEVFEDVQMLGWIPENQDWNQDWRRKDDFWRREEEEKNNNDEHDDRDDDDKDDDDRDDWWQEPNVPPWWGQYGDYGEITPPETENAPAPNEPPPIQEETRPIHNETAPVIQNPPPPEATAPVNAEPVQSPEQPAEPPPIQEKTPEPPPPEEISETEVLTETETIPSETETLSDSVPEESLTETESDTIIQKETPPPKPSNENQKNNQPPPDDFRDKPFNRGKLNIVLDHFALMADKDGNFLGIRNTENYTEEEAKTIMLGILKSEKQQGMYGWLQYYKAQKDYGTLVVVTDKTSDQGILNNLFRTTVIVGIIVLLVLFVFLIFFSRWIVQPVRDSMERQKQFVSDASHELKTPIAVLTANVDILQDEIGENKWLDYIQEQTNRMNQLVGDLLRLARMDNAKQEYEFKDFNLSTAIEATALPFESQAFEKHKNLEIDIQPDLIYHGSEQHIRQLAAIFIDNAMKYSNEHGTIKISLMKRGEKYILEFYNTGCEISQSETDKIFERFYRGDKARNNKGKNGYGLGLAIAKSIMEIHKIKIQVTCEQNAWIRFLMTM